MQASPAHDRSVNLSPRSLFAAPLLPPLPDGLLPTLLLWSGNLRTSGFVQVHLSRLVKSSRACTYRILVGLQETSESKPSVFQYSAL